MTISRYCVYCSVLISALCISSVSHGAQVPVTNGLGGSLTCADRDGDGYGTGPVGLGPFTDLTIDPSVNNKVTSASHTFVASDVGRVITITSGSGFNPSWYLISSVSSGAATLTHRDGYTAAVGTPGATGGNWVIYGCLGPDADDLDASVHTASDVLAKYGTMQKFLAHLGYTPTRIWLLDSTGTSTAGACTPSTFESSCLTNSRSIAPPVASMAAGDMIMVRGNFRGTINVISGTSSAPIIIMGYPGETPFLSTPGCGATTCMNTNGKSWFIVDGLQENGSISLGDNNYAQFPHPFHDNIFRHVYGGPAGYQGLGPHAGGDNITVEDSVFANNNYGGSQAGLYLGCTYMTPCSNFTVRRNIAYNNAWDGMHWNGVGSGHLWTQNISHDNGISGFAFQSGLTNSSITANLAFNNISAPMQFYQYKDNDNTCTTASPAGSKPCGTGPTTGNVVENNTLVSFSNSGFPADAGGGPDECFSVANHTPVNTSTNGPYFDMGHNTFRNNICANWGDISATYRYAPFNFADPTNPTQARSYFATSTFDHNLTYEYSGVNSGNALNGTGKAAFGIGWAPSGQNGEGTYDCTAAQALLTTGSISNCVSGDPKFSAAAQAYYPSPGQYDLSILSTSPAVHAGTTTGAPGYDLWGNAYAVAPSIGAMELRNATGPAVSITNPTANSTVSGTVSVSASATPLGSTTVSSVQFAVDGINVGSPVNSGPSYAIKWDTTAAANGAHTLRATATDSAGNAGSAALTVTVSNATVSGISGVSATSITASTASISWTTKTASSSQVAYGPTVAYGNTTTLDPSLVTSHSVVLSGLSAATTYHFQVLSTDSTALLSTSADTTFTTAAASVSGTLAPGTGWQDLANTHLQDVCPANNFNGIAYNFSDSCHEALTAWSGAVADTKRNRLIIWGGGHTDYSGNEVYALNLGTSTPTVTRLTNPSDFTKNSGCPENNAVDGAPVSRHTYGGLVYLPVQDKLFSLGGSKSPCGTMSQATHLLDLSQIPPVWSTADPVNGWDPTQHYGTGDADCAYDPNTQTVLCLFNGYVLRYNPATNTYTEITNTATYGYAANVVIDPKRKLLFAIGEYSYGGTAPYFIAYDISSGSSFAAQNWTSQLTGCDALAASYYPGLQYDPVLDKIVAWTGTGNTIYLFDADAKTCTAQTFSGGPPHSASAIADTFGHFQYFPALNSYVEISLASEDAYILKLPSSATASSTSPSPNPCDLNGDGVVNSTDVQLSINQVLGVANCGSAALQTSGTCNVVDVQRVILAATGGACITGH